MLKNLLIGALLGTLAACGHGEEQTPTPTQDENTLTFAVGSEYLLELESNPTTGYFWPCNIEPDTVRKIARDTYVADPAPEGLVGSGGRQEFRLIASKAGKAALECAYARSAEDVAERRAFILLATS